MGIKRKQPENTNEKKRRKMSSSFIASTLERDVKAGTMSVELMIEALAWMLARESSSTRGGILADDQGLGKTITTIALLLTAGARKPVKEVSWGGTLIVCPLSVLRQWEREINSKVSSGSALRTLLYHGDTRKVSPGDLASYDVVITTYGVVSRDIPYEAQSVRKRSGALNRRLKKSSSIPLGPLAKISWHRLVLDEAHNVRNAETRASLSCRDLESSFRWGLSGTPLQNNIEDLRVPPYNSCKKLQNDSGEKKRHNIKAAFENIVLRRSKRSLIDGKPLLNLPPRLVSRLAIKFSPLETRTYEKLEEGFSKRLDEIEDEGKKVSKLMVLVMLLRLRQMCDSPALLAGKNLFFRDEPDMEEFREMDPDDEEEQLRKMKLIREFDRIMEEKRVCPGGGGDREVLQGKGGDGGAGGDSSRGEDAGVLAVDRDAGHHGAGAGAGRDPVHQDRWLHEHQSSRCGDHKPGVTVMLLSLKAAGCGLNLTAASRVVLLDMWWNPTSEEQAIDRAHRIGQTKPVTLRNSSWKTLWRRGFWRFRRRERPGGFCIRGENDGREPLHGRAHRPRPEAEASEP